MQPPRLANTAEPAWDYFTLREADHYAKTTGRNQKYIGERADRVAHIDGPTHAIINGRQYTRASSGYKCLK